MIKDMFLHMLYSCTVRDPCKSCIVRTMCSKECLDRTRYYQYTEGMPYFYRIATFCILISIMAVCLSIFRWITDSVN